MTKLSQDALVCVIDDDKAVRDSLLVVVGTLGCQVQGFESAEAFLDSGAINSAGFLIVDVRLPGMSGLELLEKLVADQKTPPCAINTGHADSLDISLDAWPNAICVMAKPCMPDQLLQVIRNAFV